MNPCINTLQLIEAPLFEGALTQGTEITFSIIKNHLKLSADVFLLTTLKIQKQHLRPIIL